MDEETQELLILKNYSIGEIGWRKACASLGLMTITELHALLEERGFHLPPEDTTPLSDADSERLTRFLKAGGYDAD